MFEQYKCSEAQLVHSVSEVLKIDKTIHNRTPFFRWLITNNYVEPNVNWQKLVWITDVNGQQELSTFFATLVKSSISNFSLF